MSPITAQPRTGIYGNPCLHHRTQGVDCLSFVTHWIPPGVSHARWSEVFLDATAAAAVIDRIVHHATVLTTNGDSYRLKATQRNQTAHARQKKTR